MKTDRYIKTVSLFLLFAGIFLLPSKSAEAGDSDYVTLSGVIVRVNPGAGTIDLRKGPNLLVSIKVREFKTPEGVTVSPWSLQPGDRLKCRTPIAKTLIDSAIAGGSYFSGEVLFINGKKLIMAGGRQVYFTDDTVFFLNGRKCGPADVKPGIRVFLRVDPVTKRAGIVEAVELNKRSETDEDRPKVNYFNVKTTGDSLNSLSCRRGDEIIINAGIAKCDKALIDVSGIARNIPMKKSGDDNFKARYVISRADVRRAYVLLKMYKDGKEYVRIYPNTIDSACTGPEIKPISPVEDENIRGELPPIYAELSSKGSMVKSRTVSVTIDGRPLTSGGERNVAFVKFIMPDDLEPGSHVITVKAFDEAGNASVKSWNFKYLKD